MLPDFQTIVDDFNFLDEWEDRYKYIIDLGHQLEPMADEEKSDDTLVRGCASQVWLKFDDSDADHVRFHGDSDAHIVRGLVALMTSLYSGQSKTTILEIDAKAELAKLDLEDHITPQRANGLTAMIDLIRKTASNNL